ncbi:cystinosin homolog [Oratosquilla oratoria]|uniref:cystinosin homolog n=1 Tax=Oratosquilla oratoria TaxID=337810 RepID=UPI003F777AB0
MSPTTIAAHLSLVVLMTSFSVRGSPIDIDWFSPLRVNKQIYAPVMRDLAMVLLEPDDVQIVHPTNLEVNMTVRYPKAWGCVNITFDSTPRWITTRPDVITLCSSDVDGGQVHRSLPLYFNTTSIGKATVEVRLEYNGTRCSNSWLRLAVQLSPALTTTSDILGWIYTISWDVSFLPQIIHNWRRRSVVGLSFDFLAFNFLGYVTYSLFNAGLLWIPEIQAEYFDRHPAGVIHVRLNDVFFAFYGFVCTCVQIAQCFALKREVGQRTSTACWVITGLATVAVVASCIAVPLAPGFLWLDVLYICSYTKVIITAIKYTPQLFLNYKNKSTAGWSIWGVTLDFTGGLFSLIQMFLLAANYDNWTSILTDPAKLGLGLLAIFYNILFFVQHFCLYREEPKCIEEKSPPKTKDIDPIMRF